MDGDLARQLRDEAYQLKVYTRELRNKTKTLASAYEHSEARLDRLIERLEDPHAKEAQGDNSTAVASR